MRDMYAVNLHTSSSACYQNIYVCKLRLSFLLKRLRLYLLPYVSLRENKLNETKDRGQFTIMLRFLVKTSFIC